MLERRVFQNALLGFLAEGPAYGYDLALHFGPDGDLFAVGHLGRSQLYALLKALESQGLAEARLEEGEGGPARRVFHLAEPGRERLLRWLREPVASIRGLRVEFLLKLYFLSRLSLPGADDLLRAQGEVLEARLARVREEKARGTGVAPWVHELQEELMEAGLRWIGEWRRRGVCVLPTAGNGRPRAQVDERPEPNRLKATVVGRNAAGGLVRIDLESEGGRLAALLPAESSAAASSQPGSRVEVVLPPGCVVIAETPFGEK